MSGLYERLLSIRNERGAGYLVLLDPDIGTEEAVQNAEACEAAGADGLLIGGSLVENQGLDSFVQSIKKNSGLPVILFPGSGRQLTPHADGVLFLSLISGRNPQYLIGEQVMSAPIIRNMGLEPVATAYLLVESGAMTSVEFISGTKPLPRNKPAIAAAHALAAQYLGMRLVYLEAGSGAEHSVPASMVQAVNKAANLPVMVGGGIRSPETARLLVEAGAAFVVTGNALEGRCDRGRIREFADAVHQKKKR